MCSDDEHEHGKRMIESEEEKGEMSGRKETTTANDGEVPGHRYENCESLGREEGHRCKTQCLGVHMLTRPCRGFWV